MLEFWFLIIWGFQELQKAAFFGPRIKIQSGLTKVINFLPSTHKSLKIPINMGPESWSRIPLFLLPLLSFDKQFQ